MPLNEQANAAARDAQLRVVTELASLTSLQTELVVARSMCSLARQELGKIRLHHVKRADLAYQMVLELAKHIAASQDLRDDIEQVRLDISALGGFLGASRTLSL